MPKKVFSFENEQGTFTRNKNTFIPLKKGTVVRWSLGIPKRIVKQITSEMKFAATPFLRLLWGLFKFCPVTHTLLSLENIFWLFVMLGNEKSLKYYLECNS